jgi:hypothetical protein
VARLGVADGQDCRDARHRVFRGHIINGVVVARIMRLTKHTRGHWEAAVVGEIKRRVPWLALLGGAWLSLGYWSLGPYLRAFTSGASLR